MGEIDVFLSYKREQRDRVEAIGTALEDLGVKTWHDRKLRSGEHYPSELNERLEQAGIVLVHWCHQSVQSQWVRLEAEYARNNRKLACVLLEQGVSIPSDFSLLHANNLSDWNGQFDHPEWLSLMEALDGRGATTTSLKRASLSRGVGQKKEIIDLLEATLRQHVQSGTMTYAACMNLLRSGAKQNNLALPPEFDQPTLWEALDQVTERNRNRREPPLAVLVVGDQTGMPGKGYFEKHCFLRLNDEPELCRNVFEQQLKRVMTFDWSNA